MWDSDMLEFQSNLSTPLMNLMEPFTPSQDHNFLSQDMKDNQFESPSISRSDREDDPTPADLGQKPEEKPAFQPASRDEWSQSEEMIFFKFLASYMMRYPEVFLSWKKANKKGIFTDMQAKIKSKDQLQCKLKFNSYKRKHSSKRDKYHYEPCMRSLIISKLISYAAFDSESAELLEKIKSSEDDIEEKERIINSHFLQAEKEDKAMALLYSLICLNNSQKYQEPRIESFIEAPDYQIGAEREQEKKQREVLLVKDEKTCPELLNQIKPKKKRNRCI